MTKTSAPLVKADWYDNPLYYDIIFDADTEKEAAFLEALVERYAKGKSNVPLRILEPACGSGRLLSSLAKRGHEVSGFDLNENMLAYAKDRLAEPSLEAELWHGRMEDFSAPKAKFDLAHCLVSTFKYVHTEEGAVSHLKRVAASLRKGGLYALGFHLTNYQHPHAEHERWVVERDGIHVICNTHTWPADRNTRREKMRTRLRITREEQTWIQETLWEFRTYNLAQVREMFDAVPEFACVACYGFTYEIDEPHPFEKSHFDTVFILQKQK